MSEPSRDGLGPRTTPAAPASARPAAGGGTCGTETDGTLGWGGSAVADARPAAGGRTQHIGEAGGIGGDAAGRPARAVPRVTGAGAGLGGSGGYASRGPGAGLILPGRGLEAERMDHEPADPEDLGRALRDLEWLAGLGLSHRPVIAWLERIAAGREYLSVLDVGSGGGGMLRRIARWGRQRGLRLRLEGVDLNPAAKVVAERAREPWMPITFRTADAFALGPTLAPDVIISSHFAHHLDDEDLVRFLRWMERTARLGWLVNDLHRHWLFLRALQLIVRVLPFHRFVVSDGPISVRRSFVRSDWQAALEAAGIAPGRVEIRWFAPFRWGVGTAPP